jgi:N-acetylmuramoyl-L-alanine amidase
MTKSCLALAFFCLVFALPLRAFDWETATADGREYVTLHSFCLFYGFAYAAPAGNNSFSSRGGNHSITLRAGSSDAYLDGVHYVLSFPIESGDHDWLISKMDTIKLFEPLLRPTEISGRHTIRGVVIDAGHGGSDNGATSRLGNEKTYTLDTAYRLDAILRSAGLRTVFTRRTDTFVDLYERAHIASLYPDYCFVSIHFNSASEEARGLETYCLSPRGAASTSSRYLTRGDIQKLPGNDYDTQNILLASLVHSEIIRLNPGDGTADRGVKRARFVVIKMNVLPAILVEGGFVSNHMEAARVNRADYRQSLAQAIARGVIKFVNVMGDRRLALPNEAPMGNLSAQPPKALPVTPPAPTGLARDPANKTAATASAPGSHKKNKKTAAATTATVEAPSGPIMTPDPEVAAHQSESTKGGNSLNLAEPATPTPSADADKAPPEPDEPPTVNSTPPVAAAHRDSPPSTNSGSAQQP